MSCKTMFLILVALQSCRCNAASEIKAHRFVDFDGLSCPQTDSLFLQRDVRSRIECVTRCSELSDCACVFYKQDYCQGCRGLCHNSTMLPALTGTTYYFLMPALSSAAGVFSNGIRYYLIVNNPATWQDALNYCNSLGATLYYVETHAEHVYIITQLGSLDYWIGGERYAGEWVWSHSGVPIDMTLFESGQPDGTDSCARLWYGHSFKLDDFTCTWLHHFICKSL